MQSRAGFDLECAKAAMRAMKTDETNFIDRCRDMEFYGLYDPMPCGAVMIEGNIIHVASLRPCGPTFKKIVTMALQSRDILFAPIRIDNHQAKRLAEGLGFKIGITEGVHHLYWRTK